MLPHWTRSRIERQESSAPTPFFFLSKSTHSLRTQVARLAAALHKNAVNVAVGAVSTSINLSTEGKHTGICDTRACTITRCWCLSNMRSFRQSSGGPQSILLRKFFALTFTDPVPRYIPCRVECMYLSRPSASSARIYTHVRT